MLVCLLTVKHSSHMDNTTQGFAYGHCACNLELHDLQSMKLDYTLKTAIFLESYQSGLVDLTSRMKQYGYHEAIHS